MAEVKNGREKEMRCSDGRARSSSVSGLVRLPASVSPLQGRFSSSLLSLPVTLVHFLSSSGCFNPFFMYLSMENTTPFADLVSFPRCSSC